MPSLESSDFIPDEMIYDTTSNLFRSFLAASGGHGGAAPRCGRGLDLTESHALGA